MDEEMSTKKIREQLYADVWAEPMTAVAKKYNLSDNGVRKRCTSLNIPVPPFGYWAKKKAGKVVANRPPLPPYNEIVLDDIQDNKRGVMVGPPAKKTNSLELRDLDNMQIEQLSAMHGLDLIEPSSMEYFTNWLNSLAVPGRINDYDNLISRHKAEIEYREARNKAYPFRQHSIRLWTADNKINERDNISVLPIAVSSAQLNRAYRIADTIIKAFRKLKANIGVGNNGEDNIYISLLTSTASFKISESKTKRRYLVDLSNRQDFRPLYEKVYDGNLHISWQVDGYRHYSYSSHHKDPEFNLEYFDSKECPLQNQISIMILQVYEQCCENELRYTVEKRKVQDEYKREEIERHAKEEAQRLLKVEESRQAHINTLVKDIPEQANNWFKYEQLNRYADELDKHLATCSDAETIHLLQSYIRLVRENAKRFNSLDNILEKMRNIELELE